MTLLGYGSSNSLCGVDFVSGNGEIWAGTYGHTIQCRIPTYVGSNSLLPTVLKLKIQQYYGANDARSVFLPEKNHIGAFRHLLTRHAKKSGKSGPLGCACSKYCTYVDIV